MTGGGDTYKVVVFEVGHYLFYVCRGAGFKRLDPVWVCLFQVLPDFLHILLWRR